MKHPVPCFLLVLLVMGQLFITSHGLGIVKKDVEKSWRAGGHSGSSTGYFSKIFPTHLIKSTGKDGRLYGVSQRAVPQGPNPLHN